MQLQLSKSYSESFQIHALLQRAREWWAETHPGGVELTRHFLHQFFESEFITTPGQLRLVAASGIGLLMSAGFAFTQSYYHKYLILNALADGEPYRLAFLADVLFLITLAMVVMGIFTAIEWSSLFPGLKDYLALAALPVRMMEIFAAKFAALLIVAAVVAWGVALYPSALLPAVSSGDWADPGVFRIDLLVIPTIFLPKQFPATFFAMWLGGIFVFLSLVALQGVLLNLLPVRQFSRISLAVQGLLLSLLLASMTVVFSIPSLYQSMSLRPAWVVWAPPFWFLGIDQVIAGSRDPFAIRLAWAGALGITGAAAAAILSYLWSYRSHRGRVLESPSIESAAPRFLPVEASQGLLHRVVPGVPQLAVFAFIAKTLWRSRQHRLILTAFIAGSVAMIFEGFLTLAFANRGGVLTLQLAGLGQAALAVPLALSLFLLGGLRYLFRLPVELRANWIFRIHEPGQGSELLEGMATFLLYGGLLPVVAVSLPLEMAVWGPVKGIAAALAAVAPALLLAEALLFGFERIPFTSSYLPGRRPLIETVVVYTIFAAVYVWGLASMLRVFLDRPAALLLFLVMCAACWRWARHARFQAGATLRLEFEELPDDAVQLLNLDRD